MADLILAVIGFAPDDLAFLNTSSRLHSWGGLYNIEKPMPIPEFIFKMNSLRLQFEATVRRTGCSSNVREESTHQHPDVRDNELTKLFSNQDFTEHYRYISTVVRRRPAKRRDHSKRMNEG